MVDEANDGDYDCDGDDDDDEMVVQHHRCQCRCHLRRHSADWEERDFVHVADREILRSAAANTQLDHSLIYLNWPVNFFSFSKRYIY